MSTANHSFAKRLPLTIVTGFLGSGKTTILNRAITTIGRQERLAIVVNELGRIDIDARMLKERHAEVVELSGGCVCHRAGTQEELWTVIAEVARRGTADRIVLETTGIAEPAPILDALARLPEEARFVYDDGIVTLVDGAAGLPQLERYVEARAQVKAADRVLLTKLDLADPKGFVRLHEALVSLNPRVERAAFPLTWEGSSELTHFLFDRPRRARRPGAPRLAHCGDQLSVVAIEVDRPFLAAQLMAFCRELGPRLVRAKGFVDVLGEPRRGFLEKAGDRLELRFGAPWRRGPRKSELVFIGADLEVGTLRNQLCTFQVATA